MLKWFKEAESIEGNTLRIPFAKNLFSYIKELDKNEISLDGVYRLNSDMELIYVTIFTNCGQFSKFPFNATEPIGILCDNKAISFPLVMALRENFPRTPHQILPKNGFPSIICYDNRPWREAQLTFTPQELIYRIFYWFKQSSLGRLHGQEQLLDPNIIGDMFSIILDDIDIINNNSDLLLYGEQCSPNSKYYRLTTKEIKNSNPIAGLIIHATPVEMGVLQHAPTNFLSFVTYLNSINVNLSSLFKKFIIDNERLYETPLCIILILPIVRPGTDNIEYYNTIAILSNDPLGELGIALDLLDKDPTSCRYAPLLASHTINEEKLSQLQIFPCTVNYTFSRTLARTLSLNEDTHPITAALIGAGAAGSTVVEPLFREGVIKINCILDHDILLPHNLSRHSLTLNDVGIYKAEQLAARLNQIFPEPTIHPYCIDVFDINDQVENYPLLSEADVILDATASVAASRKINDLPIAGRRICFFYNPSATAVCILAEDSKRTVDQRTLEAHLYRFVLTADTFSDFWLTPIDQVPYAGQCRSLTTRLPYSRIQLLSGLISTKISKLLKENNSYFFIAKNPHETDDIISHNSVLQPSISRSESGWTVRILKELEEELFFLRTLKLPSETGGILLGIVDLCAQQVEVVATLPPPPDSQSSTTFFERGTKHLEETIRAATGKCHDQVRYIGEWHSHPEGILANPSTLDLQQRKKLSKTLSLEGCPFIQVIVGEDGLSISISSQENEL